MKHIIVRHGTKADLPAGGTIEGELRWCTDTHELYIDDDAGNILINKTEIVLNYKGVMDCSGSPNYPAGTLGDVYFVSVAGKIGGVAGKTVAIGDMFICNVDTVTGNEAAVGSKWDVIISAGLTTYELKLVNDADNMPVTTNIVILVIPSEKTGMNLINAQASVTTPSNAVVSYQIRNLTDGVDMLTTPITIDIGEYSSYTAVTPSVIDITKDDVFTADRIGISKTVAGTTEKGDTIILTFSSP